MNYKFFLLRKEKNSDNRDNKERLIACRTIRLRLLVDEHVFFFLGKISEESGIAISSQVMNKIKNSKEMFYKRGTVSTSVRPKLNYFKIGRDEKII